MGFQTVISSVSRSIDVTAPYSTVTWIDYCSVSNIQRDPYGGRTWNYISSSLHIVVELELPQFSDTDAINMRLYLAVPANETQQSDLGRDVTLLEPAKQKIKIIKSRTQLRWQLSLRVVYRVVHGLISITGATSCSLMYGMASQIPR